MVSELMVIDRRNKVDGTPKCVLLVMEHSLNSKATRLCGFLQPLGVQADLAGSGRRRLLASA